MDDTNSWGGGTSIQKRVQEIGLYGIEWGGGGIFLSKVYIFITYGPSKGVFVQKWVRTRYEYLNMVLSMIPRRGYNFLKSYHKVYASSNIASGIND